VAGSRPVSVPADLLRHFKGSDPEWGAYCTREALGQGPLKWLRKTAGKHRSRLGRRGVRRAPGGGERVRAGEGSW